MRFMPFGLYGPVDETLDLAGRAALGMGLVAIGSGLRPEDLFGAGLGALCAVRRSSSCCFRWSPSAWRSGFGVTGSDLVYLTLCAAVPTAMNGYLLARQLGGDARSMQR